MSRVDEQKVLPEAIVYGFQFFVSNSSRTSSKLIMKNITGANTDIGTSI